MTLNYRVESAIHCYLFLTAIVTNIGCRHNLRLKERNTVGIEIIYSPQHKGNCNVVSKILAGKAVKENTFNGLDCLRVARPCTLGYKNGVPTVQKHQCDHIVSSPEKPFPQHRGSQSSGILRETKLISDWYSISLNLFSGNFLA